MSVLRSQGERAVAGLGVRGREQTGSLIRKAQSGRSGRGAMASDEEFEAVVTYLAKYFGKGQAAEKSN